MELPERKEAILLIGTVLKNYGGRKLPIIYNAIREAFPRHVPLYAFFVKVYHDGITASELFNALFPKLITPAPKKQLTPKTRNVKHGIRHDPFEVRRPDVKKKNWLRDFDNPSIVFSKLGSKGDVALCDMNDEEARRRYEASGNMLFVFEAFFRRVDMLSGSLSEPQIRDAKPKSHEYWLHDGGGLCLSIKPDGTKQWCLVDHYFGNHPDHYFGDYPDRSLSYARRYYLAWRDLIAKGKCQSTTDKEEYEREIEARIDCHYDEEPHVSIPAWMAQSLSDGFKQYYSRRFIHGKDATLDESFGVGGKKHHEEFDTFTIDSRTLVEKTREVQWNCNLAFATACKYALRILELESSARGDNIDYKYTHALVTTLCANEARGDYGTYAAWYKDKGYTFVADKMLRESFMELIEAIDPDMKQEIENDMKDSRKKHFKNLL